MIVQAAAAAGDGGVTRALTFLASFIAGGLFGVVATIATFRAALAVLERSSTEQARQLGACEGRVEDVRRDMNGIAGKYREALDALDRDHRGARDALARELRAEIARA